MKIFSYASACIGLLLLSACGGEARKNNGEKRTAEDEALLSLTSEPLIAEQWALIPDKNFYAQKHIDGEAHIHGQMLLSNYSGKGIKIAVIDAALNASHNELQGRVTAMADAHTGGAYLGCGFGSECDHGMAVTGIVASAINNQGLRGIAPQAELVFIHLGLDGFVLDSDFINAFDLALKYDVDIILCSWGTGDVSDLVAQKIEQLANNGRGGKGINIIFAAGNDSGLMKNDESMLEAVIGVGSSDESNERSSYSSYGSGLDVLAPGGNLLGITTLRYKNRQYRQAIDSDAFNGTSAAAPVVAGLVALLLQAKPELSREQVRSIIVNSADKIGDRPYQNGHNNFYGYGKVNFDAAFTLLKKQ